MELLIALRAMEPYTESIPCYLEGQELFLIRKANEGRFRAVLSRFAELEYRGEYSCTSLSLHAGNLTVSYGNEGKAELLKINLESGEKTKISLSAAVNFVYACSYDSAEGGYAVYYRFDRNAAAHHRDSSP